MGYVISVFSAEMTKIPKHLHSNVYTTVALFDVNLSTLDLIDATD